MPGSDISMDDTPVVDKGKGKAVEEVEEEVEDSGEEADDTVSKPLTNAFPSALSRQSSTSQRAIVSDGGISPLCCTNHAGIARYREI